MNILPLRWVKNQSSPWNESACLLTIGLEKNEKNVHVPFVKIFTGYAMFHLD